MNLAQIFLSCVEKQRSKDAAKSLSTYKQAITKNKEQ